VAHKIAYARVSTADQNPDFQLDALAAESYLKIYTNVATGTKADRPQWNECLKNRRPGDTLIIGKSARLAPALTSVAQIDENWPRSNESGQECPLPLKTSHLSPI
jgi:DNA invertase Pin-like site-specific DNA recombinase